MHKTMGIDIETYSSTDLQSCGVHRYVEDPDFDILIIGYKFDDEDEVRQIDCTEKDANGNRLISVPGRKNAEFLEFIKALYDPAILKTAFNAAFERTCFTAWLKREMPPEEWQDTMVKAMTLGLPRTLADVGVALGLPEDKLKDPIGKSLITYFSKPCKPTKANGGRIRNYPEHDPDKWKLYLRYNKQDVITEQAILEALSPYKITDSEKKLWDLDQRMNDLGVRIDTDMVEKIVDYDTKRTGELKEEAQEITGLDNPNSLAQIKKWLLTKGVNMPSITKDTLDEKLKEDLPDDVRRLLEIRQALGKTSVAKYSTMLDAVCSDHRIKGILQFYGANRSGRWSGRLVQIHNLARNTLPDLDLARELTKEGDFDSLQTLFGETSFIFSELVRTAFIPSEGNRFIVSDFSAIEARVISWLSGEEWRLKAFREGKDIYCESASQMYHVPVVKHGINGELRQKGKIAELALGYQGGVGAMKSMDKEGSIPEEEMQGIVDQWRSANPAIVKLWRDYESAAKICIEERRSVRRGIRVGITQEELEARESMADGPVRPYSVIKGCNITFSYINGNLFITLPNGRKLCYWKAKLRPHPKGWGDQIYYKGLNQTTHKWEDVETYGGKIVENIVQAIARDCLANVITKVSSLGYKIVMHVHDEIIVDVPKEDTEAPDRITAIMSEPIEWAPGLPLTGDTYETDFYKKD